MTSAHRSIALLAWVLPGLAVLASCGGGDSSSGAGNNAGGPGSGEHNFSGGGSNVVAMTVGNGPGGATQSTFNIPYTSVTVCLPNSTTCATITNVLVDTGSTGLRLMKSVLASEGLTLTALADPGNSANTMHECLPFADGFAWGAVATATVRLGGETASSVPVEIIDDSSTPSPSVPASCASDGQDLNSVTMFDANGVLGVGVFLQDCGRACVVTPSNDVYYSCSAAGSCISAVLPDADQVSNPVASFATDNNGVILQLPTIAATGAASASGYLVFGIGSESNNQLQGATILTTDGEGDFNTSFNGSMSSAFFDSGSNALFFPDSALPPCAQSGGGASFYCPSSTATLSATNQGANGSTNAASFQITNLNSISGSDFAINDAGGQTTSVTGLGKNYFDWGLPFFYGNTIFVAIEGTVAGGTVGPYVAY